MLVSFVALCHVLQRSARQHKMTRWKLLGISHHKTPLTWIKFSSKGWRKNHVATNVDEPVSVRNTMESMLNHLQSCFQSFPTCSHAEWKFFLSAPWEKSGQISIVSTVFSPKALLISRVERFLGLPQSFIIHSHHKTSKNTSSNKQTPVLNYFHPQYPNPLNQSQNEVPIHHPLRSFHRCLGLPRRLAEWEASAWGLHWSNPGPGLRGCQHRWPHRQWYLHTWSYY